MRRKKKIVQAAGRAVRKAASSAKKVLRSAGRAVGSVALAPLIPLMPLLRRIYKRRTGKDLPRDHREAAEAFYREVVKRSHGFSYDIDPATLTMIVTAILSFLREMAARAKEKKARGEKLTEEEEQALQSASAVKDAEQADAESLALIAEYLPLMRSIYKSRTGKDLPSDPFAAARAFYAEVVLPAQQRFDFDATMAFDADEQPAYDQPAYDADGFDIKTVLAGIIAFFRAVRDRVRAKEQRGESVGEAEKTIADKVDRVEGGVREEVKGQVTQDVKLKVGDAIVRYAPLALAAAVVFYLVRKK